MTAAPQDASPKARRYFYRDLQAVAWMEDKFDMGFVSADGREITVVDGAMIADAFGEHDSVDVAIVASESLPLLEPIEGDIILSANKQHAILVGKRPFAEQSVEDARANVAEHGFRIIQRDGVAFHSPEQEAA